MRHLSLLALFTTLPAAAGDYVLLLHPASYPRDIADASNHVGVGTSGHAVGTHAGLSFDLSLTGVHADVQGVNGLGEMVGRLGPVSMATLWVDGAPTTLGALPGHATSFAQAISDAGQVVGTSQMIFDYGARGFSWTPAGGMVELLPLPAPYDPLYLRSIPSDVNEAGTIVGHTSAGTGDLWGQRAAMWSPSGGLPTVLGALGVGAANDSDALAINGSGVAVGWSDVDVGGPHAARFTGGLVTDLGLLPGDYNSEATDIAEDGTVVGWSAAASGTERAFLYDGVMTLLIDHALPGHPFGTLSRAMAIGKDGVIVGAGGSIGSSTTVGFMMLPEDLPLTLLHVTTMQAGLGPSLATVFGTPGKTTTLLGGLPTGRTRIPGCPTWADLSHPVVLGSAIADAQGRVAISFAVPAAAAGREVAIVAVERATCQATPAGTIVLD